MHDRHMANMHRMHYMHCMHVLHPYMHHLHGGIYKRVEEKEKDHQSINQASYVLNQENNNKKSSYPIGDVSYLSKLKLRVQSQNWNICQSS